MRIRNIYCAKLPETRDSPAHHEGHLETLINRPTFTAEAKPKCRLIATNMIRKHERARLPKSDRVTLKSLRNDKDIVILRAGNCEATVVMNRHEYVNKRR